LIVRESEAIKGGFCSFRETTLKNQNRESGESSESGRDKSRGRMRKAGSEERTPFNSLS
jgi:hypothetical protein